MKKVLIFGGTRFFGKKLVSLLLEKGANVTLATRGQTEDHFGNLVNRVIIDRRTESEAWKELAENNYDVVYDNICYSSNESALAMKFLEENTKRYIFTSTLSVYDAKEEAITEEDFEPCLYPLQMLDADEVSYGEGKRQAESYFFQKSNVPAVAVRFPIVLGTDDYTKRLLWHIDRIKNEEEIGMPNQAAKMCFINSDEAAKWLYWIGMERSETGPMNACSNDQWELGALLHRIKDVVGKKAMITEQTNDANHSPFGILSSWYMTNELATKTGFSFQNLEDWLPDLINSMNRE